MKLLTATAATQGHRANDFHWCTEGELVWVQEEESDCDRYEDTGTSRAWVGMSSHRATSTAVVADLPLTGADLREALRGYLESAGFAAYIAPDELAKILNEEVELLSRIGGRYPVGMVVERQGPLMRARGRAAQSDVA